MSDCTFDAPTPFPYCVTHDCFQNREGADLCPIGRVREVCETAAFALNEVPTMAVTVSQILHALDGPDE